MNKESNNFFDELGADFDPSEAFRVQKEMEAKAEKLDHLIHKTFAQDGAGKELLQLWAESLMMASTAEPGMDSLEVGIREGQKRFIRAILLTIKRVEDN